MLTKKLFAGPAIVALLVAVPLGLTSCASLGSLTEAGVEQAIEGATGGNLDIDTGEAVSIPADFPSEVPLIDATLFSTVGVGADAQRSWTIIYTVADAPSAFTDAASQLTAAGFSEISNVASPEGSFATFTNANWNINLSAIPAMNSEEPKVVYLVSAAQ